MTDKREFLQAPGFAGSQYETIAYKRHMGASPTLIWCGGLKSDMKGGKATHLHNWAQKNNHGYIRFDYFGHGASTGQFRNGTISRWSRDIVQIIDDLTTGKIILIGSSMGGWAAILAALDRPEHIKALVLIAPAPDFTEKLIWENWSDDKRKILEQTGSVFEPSDYGEPYEYSQTLIEDGRTRQVLDSPINFTGPVRILQGGMDTIVPPSHSRKLVDAMESTDVTYTLVKSGDHSLSRTSDLSKLTACIEEILKLPL